MDDRAIIELLFARDEQAIGALSERYGDALLALSERITGIRADAEECVSDTYLAAWNAIPPLCPEHLYAWLAAVTRNASRKRVEAAMRQKRGGMPLELSEELAACIPSPDTVEQELEEARLSLVLDTFLRALPYGARYVFLKRYFHSEPIDAIARATGYSQSKIKSMLHRTRKKLKITLEKEGFSI